jgi:aminocarboxymuconate-semialdehyde decarboxylase
MEKFPKLRIAFAHGGGSFPYTLGRIQHGFDVRPDLVAIDNQKPPTEYLGRFWVDSLVHDKNSFQYLLTTIGEDKVCLGSDYPFPLGEHRPGELIEQMMLDKNVKEKLFHKNAIDWLGF